MPIYAALKYLEGLPCPTSDQQAEFVLSKFPIEIQEKLIASIYSGRDHIYLKNINFELLTRSADLKELGITKTDYARIIKEKCTNLTGSYIPAIIRCANNSNYDLNQI